MMHIRILKIGSRSSCSQEYFYSSTGSLFANSRSMKISFSTCSFGEMEDKGRYYSSVYRIEI